MAADSVFQHNQATDPGAVGAGHYWLDTSTAAAPVIKRRDEANAAWVTVGAALDPDLTTIAGLVDPDADRLLFWDDSAGAYAYLTLGTGLSIDGTTITAVPLDDSFINRETEIDFAVPTVSACIWVEDADISDEMIVTAFPSGKACTNGSADENEMDALVLSANPGDGGFTLFVTAIPGPVLGSRLISYRAVLAA